MTFINKRSMMNIDLSHINPIIKLTNPDQVGIVVEDANSAALSFAKVFGADPVEVLDWPAAGFDPESYYYGKPAHWKMRVGFFQIGNLQWELIQPLEGPNIFADFLKEHGPGLHHIRFTEPDFDQHAAALQAAGIPMISNGKGIHKVSRWAYFDTRAVLNGYLLEMRKL
jgi:catechol 2,3-dioxygenase-like lactoylglutathione lyase family enzyme